MLAGGGVSGAALLRVDSVSTTNPMPTSNITIPTMIANSATFSAK